MVQDCGDWREDLVWSEADSRTLEGKGCCYWRDCSCIGQSWSFNKWFIYMASFLFIPKGSICFSNIYIVPRSFWFILSKSCEFYTEYISKIWIYNPLYIMPFRMTLTIFLHAIFIDGTGVWKLEKLEADSLVVENVGPYHVLPLDVLLLPELPLHHRQLLAVITFALHKLIYL